MPKKTTQFDHLKNRTNAELSGAINRVLVKGESEGPAAFFSALGAIAKTRNMSQLARTARLSRVSLYKALTSAGNPSFDTVFKVVKALGLQLYCAVEPRAEKPLSITFARGTLYLGDVFYTTFGTWRVLAVGRELIYAGRVQYRNVSNDGVRYKVVLGPRIKTSKEGVPVWGAEYAFAGTELLGVYLSEQERDNAEKNWSIKYGYIWVAA